MTTMASQITSLTIVYSTVYSDADQRKHQSSVSLAFVWGNHSERWIPHTKGQLRGKCFHLMTSSWRMIDETSQDVEALRNLSHKCPGNWKAGPINNFSIRQADKFNFVMHTNAVVTPDISVQNRNRYCTFPSIHIEYIQAAMFWSIPERHLNKRMLDMVRTLHQNVCRYLDDNSKCSACCRWHYQNGLSWKNLLPIWSQFLWRLLPKYYWQYVSIDLGRI